MRHLRGLLESRAWTKLVPDEKREFVAGGHGEYAKNDYATAAVASDGSFGFVYLPGVRTITVDLSRIKGEATTEWFDPTSGVYCAAAAGEGGRFTTPGKNACGDGDWVLVVEGK